MGNWDRIRNDAGRVVPPWICPLECGSCDGVEVSNFLDEAETTETRLDGNLSTFS